MAAPAAPHHDPTQRVEVDSTNKAGKLPVYEVDSKQHDAPGVILLQEWWGVNDQMKQRAATFAAHGFRVVVPDLYRGTVIDFQQSEKASHTLNNLDWPGAVEDIAAAAKYLQTKGSKKVGVTGYCMGGALSLAAAVRVDGVQAASCYYGIPSPALADPAKSRCPVQCHFGDKDTHVGFSDKASADKLEEALKGAGIEHEFFRYPHSGHAFANDQRPEAYNKADSQHAFERTVNFFKKHLA